MITGIYKQYIPDLQLSIERGTDAVPDDGRFYVLRAGKVLKGFGSLKKAQELYKGIIQESGYKPPEKERALHGDVDRYLDSKSLYWAEYGALDHKRRGVERRGGY